MAKHDNLKLNKGLGQHFLEDQDVLLRIFDEIKANKGDLPILEVGPGAGALSAFLKEFPDFKLIEFDKRWAEYLPVTFPELEGKVINADFLKTDISTLFDTQFNVVGNFPYNISSQILFKVLEQKESVPYVLGMFQREVGARICAEPGSKTYGIISVLLQCHFETNYLFDVPREAFNPPPKVVSGVIELRRKDNVVLACNAKLFKSIVKTAFNQRRKMMRSSLKQFITPEIRDLAIFSERPEQLSVDAFVNLTNLIEHA